MRLEDGETDRKSLRLVTGRSADWDAIARDCVCFANARGGRLLIGIEDGEELPPAGQTIPVELPERLRRRVGELTVNVQVMAEVRTAANGGAYVELTIARAGGIASTSDGRYFLRVDTACNPIVGDDVLRLADERPGFAWESMTVAGIDVARADPAKVASLGAALRGSPRVKDSVKDKTDGELLTHYGLAADGRLTHLGILLVGRTSDRAALGTAPVVQIIKRDERGEKIGKWLWDDYTLTPPELVDAVWREIPDFRESYEVPDGMFRRTVPAYDEKVVRELLVNALVHRPYTQRGDIFIELHPDRLEIVNPGRLPLGVTPHNILHASRRRNDGLARVFHDLVLMEKEGSGFDLLYDRLLSSGRPAPTVAEGGDSVRVAIARRILEPEIAKLLREVDASLQLTQRERIALAVLARSDGLSSQELGRIVGVEDGDSDGVRAWLGRLPAKGVVEGSGNTRARRYFVAPSLLRGTGIVRRTSLARISPHRLRALIEEDLRRHPGSSSSEIHHRVGPELSLRTLRRVLEELVRDGQVVAEKERRWRRYRWAGASGPKDTKGG